MPPYPVAKDVFATTGELYRLLDAASNDVGQVAYHVQRQAYLRTHQSAKRFRYTPTADHQFLIVLLGTSRVDGRGLSDLITSHQSYVLMRGAPLAVSRIFSTLAQALATALDVPASA